MNSLGVDVVTIMHAIRTLEQEYLGLDRQWRTYNQKQYVLFELYRRFGHLLAELDDVKAKASTDWQVLNAFLVENGFDEMFKQPLDGIGAVSIVDMLVAWAHKAQLTVIYGRDGEKHVAFEIPKEGREVYEVKTLDGTLARLKTKSGVSLWLTMPQDPPTLMDLIKIAFTTMSAEMKPAIGISTVQVPEISLDLKPDISFLQGADTHDNSGQYWYIDQAMQQMILKINREGASVKVASGIAMRKAISLGPKPLIFDRPFIGWFTQPGLKSMPIGMFYAHFKSWTEVDSLRGDNE